MFSTTCLPSDSLTTKAFNKLTDKLTTHFKAKAVNILTCCHGFHRLSQGHESIAESMAELWHLASNWNFGTLLKQALRDHLVFRIHSEATLEQLLTQSDIALSKVIQLALSIETAQKDSQVLKGFYTRSPQAITFYKPHWGEQQEKACYCCGNANHTSSACGFCEAKCHACRNIGHIARVCRTKAKHAAAETVPGSSESPTQMHSPTDSPQMEVIWQLRTDNASHPVPTK